MTAQRIGFLLWPQTRALTLALAEEALRVARRLHPEALYDPVFMNAEQPAEGEGWRARVLPGGADFQRIASDTASELDARYGLETDAGELIYVRNHAIRTAPPEAMQRLLRGEPVDPAQIYFRCSPRFETTSKALHWITERLFIGVGVRHPAQVVMRFFAVQ